MTVGVVAVGNRFAGDDAVGPLVLDALREAGLPAGVVAVERDGELEPALRALAEAILLRLPVIEGEEVDGDRGKALRPGGVGGIAENGFDEDHVRTMPS